LHKRTQRCLKGWWLGIILVLIYQQPLVSRDNGMDQIQDSYKVNIGPFEPGIQYDNFSYQAIAHDQDSVQAKRQRLLVPSTGRIDSLEPVVVAAGVGQKLTIQGRGFGSNPGAVWWTSGDTSATWTRTMSSGWSGYTLSWSDSKIEMVVPSGVGTGPVKVITKSGETITYDQSIEVLFNLENPNQFYSFPTYSRQAAVDPHGGYTFFFAADFPEDARKAFHRAVNTWVHTVGVNWSVAESTTDRKPNVKDGVCVVGFDTETTTGDIIGRATSYYSICTGDPGAVLKEVDIVFDPTVTWFYGEDLSAIQPEESDMESVALHELGHALQLGHSCDQTDIMHSVHVCSTRWVTPGAALRGALFVQKDAHDGAACGQTLMRWLQVQPMVLGIERLAEASLMITAEVVMHVKYELESSVDCGNVWTTLPNTIFGGKPGLYQVKVPIPSQSRSVIWRAAVAGWESRKN
jgi:hypothetical protein